MKKILAVLLAVALLLTLSVSVLALPSSQGEELNKVVVNHTNTGENSEKPEVKAVVVGDTITLIPGKSETLTFNGWALFTDSAATTIAIDGKDYELVDILLENGESAKMGVHYAKSNGRIIALNGTMLSLVLKPIADTLYVSDCFEGVTIKFNVESPKTGVSVNGRAVALACLAVLAGAALVYSKKSVAAR